MTKTIARQISEHFGWDIEEIKDYEYQPGRWTRKVYAGFDGNRYWSAGKTAPRLRDGVSEIAWRQEPSSWPGNPDLWIGE